MSASAITPTAGRLDQGDTWLLGVQVRDDIEGDLTDATVTVTVTLPDASTATPEAVREELGVYIASQPVTQLGRYTAKAVVSGAVVSVVVFAVQVEAPSNLPTLPDLKAYLGGALGFAEARWTDQALQAVLDAEKAAQARVCRVGAIYPDDLRSALLRRCQRAIALRSLPLAVLQGDSEEGGSDLVLPGRDPEVRRLEAPHRKVIVG